MSNKGYKFTDEQKKRLSDAHKGIKFSESHIKNLSLWQKGKKLSEKHKQKLSLAHKGLKPWLNRKHKTESLEKMSLSAKKSFEKGRKPWNFIEDRTKLKRHLERGGSAHEYWSKSVKKRDYWKCKLSNDECKGRIESHHIYSWSKFPALRYNIENGITLCHFHHPRTRDDEEKLKPILLNLLDKVE